MKLTSYRSTCTARKPKPPQLKFNCLFNDHFHYLFFFFQKYFVRKNWRGEVESLLKNGTVDGYAYQTCYSRARFTLREAPGTLGIFAKSSCRISVNPKKSSTI